MAKVSGTKRYLDRLNRITGPAAVKRIGAALYAAGDIIAAEAVQSITAGSVSGKHHVPSRPGQPPMNDTGVLKNNIEVALVEPLKVEVSSNAPYAAALEFGTSKMSERPYLRPAVKAKRKAAVRLVHRAVNEIIRKG